MITTIDRYPLHPGLLVEWTLHPIPSVELAPDFRKASYLQEEHVRAEAMLRQAGASVGSWLATAFDLPDRVDPDTMESVLLTVIGRHESLRSGFRLTGHRLTRFTYAATEIELRAKVVGEFSTGEEIAAYLEPRFDEATNPLDNPLPSVFAAVIRPDRTTVLVASDHTRTDGYSIFLAPHEIHEIYAAEREDREPDRLAEVGSHVDFSHGERTEAAAIGAQHRGVRVWQDFLDSCGGSLPQFPLERGVLPGQLPEWGGLHEPLLSTTEADAFDTACKDAGGHFLTGLAAAVAIAVHELGGPPEFHTTIPVHTRTHGRWAASLGWYVNSMPVSIQTAGADDFVDVNRAVRTALRRALPALKVPCSRAWELAGVVPVLRSMISFMDLRATPGSEHWNDWNVACLGKPPPGDHVFFWLLRTHDGVSITAVYPDTEVSQDTIPRLCRRIGDIMTTVGRMGGYPIQRLSA
ncbi:MAG: mycolipenoyl-CoA---2-(long-chain-fatty acyl)-trehalose mycolipenoyltransferase [Pseudonocardiales bacterium]|nr:mycolipenoyl-CoA---2-(long-chain-fatty acyl)-trehalose mycolipenoyltransferase [Pseudonocardiales bacterium]